MPIDINVLRKDKGGDPDKVKKSEIDRFTDTPNLVDEVIDLDARWVKCNYSMETAKMNFNANNKEIADKKKSSKGKDKCEDLVAKSGELKKAKEELEVLAEELKVERDSKLGKIGNVLHTGVPIFKDEDNNKVHTTWGTEKIKDLPKVDGKTLGKLNHHHVMESLDLFEMERGSKVAGHRGYYLKGNGVLLNQALINFGLATLVKNNYTPLQPPYFMKSSIMHETCQLSDFEENLYKVEGTDDKDPLYLIATSEQPISAMHKNEFMDPAELPLRYGGNSSCFRKEAGSHGKDVWGLFRIHQFEKIEQFILSAPDKSWEEFDKMIATSESFYQALGLPYQVIKIVSGALNDAAALKMDLEAWFPGYDAFRELVSCSNCTDYQSRALEIRYAEKNLEKGKSTPFVHLLNGTLCATERTLCCIVENYQTPEGLNIPECLQPYMAGVKFIPYNEKRVKGVMEKIAKQEEEAKKEAEKAAAAAKKGKGKDAKPKADKKAEPKKEEKKAAAPAPAKKAEAAKPSGPAPIVQMQYKKVNKDLQNKLNQYEATLEKNQYLNGSQMTSLDADAAAYLKPFAGELSPVSHPNVFGWYSFVMKFNPKMMSNLPKVEAAAPVKKAAKKEEKDDMDDLFGSDSDDGAAAKAAAAAAKAKATTKKKKVVIAMSLVMLEVKPVDDTTDLDALAPKIFKEITQDGLFWKTEYKKVPVAFGIFKLIIGFSCEDEKTSVDDIVEKIEAMEDFVQSVEISAFNKI